MAENQLTPAAGQPAGQHNVLDVPASWGLTIPVGDYRTSLDETTAAGRKALYEFLSGSGLKPENLVNVDATITDLSIMPVQKLVGDEQLPLPRLGVHHLDGTFTEFVSPGVLKSLGFLIKRVGPPPWSPPLHVRLERFAVGVTPEGAPKYMYRYKLME